MTGKNGGVSIVQSMLFRLPVYNPSHFILLDCLVRQVAGFFCLLWPNLRSLFSAMIELTDHNRFVQIYILCPKLNYLLGWISFEVYSKRRETNNFPFLEICPWLIYQWRSDLNYADKYQPLFPNTFIFHHFIFFQNTTRF